jgi:hypothetical protein
VFWYAPTSPQRVAPEVIMMEGPGINCPFGHYALLGEHLPGPAGVRAPANRDPLAWRPRARRLIESGPRLLH